MTLENLALDYLQTINDVKKKLESLGQTLNTTHGLESKRKLRKKILSLESVLRQNIEIYNYLKNYYNKEMNVHGFM